MLIIKLHSAAQKTLFFTPHKVLLSSVVQMIQTILTILILSLLPFTPPLLLSFPVLSLFHISLIVFSSPNPLVSPPPCSMQTEGAGHGEGAKQHAEEVAAGLHRPAAAHPAGHLQGKQAAVQGDAAHHLTAAGPRTHHRQQLLHERPPPELGQMDRRRRQPRRPIFGIQHLYQSVIIDGEEWGGGRKRQGRVGLGWGRGDGDMGRLTREGMVGLRARVEVSSGRSEEENQTFYIFCLFVCFAFVEGDKLREGLLTATTCL